MTTARDITIYQGQEFTLSLDYAGATGRAQVMHIRLADSTATVVQILTHNGAANSRVIYNDATQKLDITIGATVSDAWVVLADRVEWVFDIKDYEPGSEDGAVIPYRGKVILRGTRTRPSDVTPSPQMPSGDGRYTRFDGEQNLTPEQMAQAQINILGEEYAPGGGSGDVVGPASATDSRIAEFDGTTGKLIKQSSYTIATLITYVVARAQHTGTQLASTISDFASAAIAAVTWSTITGKPSTFDPSAHKTSHATGGGDALTASDIGAATAGHGHTGTYQPLATVLTNTTASFTTADETKLDAIEALADVTDAGNVGTAIDAATEKTTPVDADTVPLIDSAAANVLKKLSWANIKATAKTYFDTLYQAILVSGTNIKTVNSTSLLGSGDIAISGGLTKFTEAESTASPNGTVYVDSFTAAGASTNVDFAAVPKGTGAVIASVSDSTATGGNKRGGYAVDWQRDRTSAANVASGGRSTISGGRNNTASATDSTVIGGGGNAASGVGSVAGGAGNFATGAYSCAIEGVNGTTRGVIASSTHAMQRRAADGDRQVHRMVVACAARTDATPTVMTSDTGAASATNQMVLPNNSSMFFEVDVVAHDSTLKSASWKVQGTIRRGANAAATAIVGTNVTTTFGSDLSGGSPGVTCTADTTNGALQVTFTGIAATTIYPSGHIRTVIAA